jgi:hypothetical protein
MQCYRFRCCVCKETSVCQGEVCGASARHATSRFRGTAPRRGCSYTHISITNSRRCECTSCNRIQQFKLWQLPRLSARCAIPRLAYRFMNTNIDPVTHLKLPSAHGNEHVRTTNICLVSKLRQTSFLTPVHTDQKAIVRTWSWRPSFL